MGAEGHPKKLIGRAVEYAEGDEGDEGSPPAELRLAWDCEHWGCLPDPGGLYDQDYAVMERMRVLSNVYRVVARLPNLVGAQIHTLTDGERRLLRWLRDNELWQT